MWHEWGRGQMFTGLWTLGRYDRWGELDSAGSGWSPVASFCEHGNEPSGSVKEAAVVSQIE